MLVKAREASGLTQVEVAARLAKPQSYVSKCERGERRVDLSEFIEIADALNLDVSSFIQDFRAELKRIPVSAPDRKSRQR